MCEMFHCDRLRNDGALGNRKSDNNNNAKNNHNNKSNVGSVWGFVSGSENYGGAQVPTFVRPKAKYCTPHRPDITTTPHYI